MKIFDSKKILSICCQLSRTTFFLFLKCFLLSKDQLFVGKILLFKVNHLHKLTEINSSEIALIVISITKLVMFTIE